MRARIWRKSTTRCNSPSNPPSSAPKLLLWTTRFPNPPKNNSRVAGHAKLVRFAALSSRPFLGAQMEEEEHGPKRFFEDYEHGHCGNHTCARIACRQFLG